MIVALNVRLSIILNYKLLTPFISELQKGFYLVDLANGVDLYKN